MSRPRSAGLTGWLASYCKRALEWAGFPPTQREAYLTRRLQEAAAIVARQQATLARVERLVRYRESLEAGVIETSAVRAALSGQEAGR